MFQTLHKVMYDGYQFEKISTTANVVTSKP